MRTPLLLALFLVGCGREHAMTAPQAGNPYGLKAALHEPSLLPRSAPPATPEPPAESAEPPSPNAVAPQIAYSYSIRYDLGRKGPAALQEKHQALCREIGPERCRVLRSTTSAEDSENWSEDQTEFLIDARLAAEFNQRLDAIAGSAGAALRHRQTSAEDVTAEVIDIDARVRAKQALADRLLQLIRSGRGGVGDLVQAERAYAETQAELDAARGKLAELRRRVRMSQVNVAYLHHGSTGVFAPVRRSVNWAGQTLADSLAALVTFVIAAAPWALLLAVLLWLRRRLGWRWPLGRRAEPPA